MWVSTTANEQELGCSLTSELASEAEEQPPDRAVFANPTLPGPSDPVRWMKTSLQSLDEMIDAGFNSPSIILWAFFNEAR